MHKFIAAVFGLAALAVAVGATPTSAQQKQKWKDATGNTVEIVVPRNHGQCMRNGKLMGYSEAQNFAHCCRAFPGGHPRCGA